MTNDPVFIDDLKFIPGERDYLNLEGSEGYICVKSKPSDEGYFWCACTRYGYAATLEEAMQWARTIAEQLATPANLRQIEGLGPTPQIIKKMNIA